MYPHFGNMLGGTPLLITGPCIEELNNQNIESMHTLTCKFGEEEVGGVGVGSQFLCISPQLSITGRVTLQLTLMVPTLTYGSRLFHGEEIFYSCKFLELITIFIYKYST